MSKTSKETSTEVRALRAQDQARWNELWRGYIDFYRVSLPDAVTERTWERLLDPAVDIHGLGAVRGGELIGIVHFLFHPVTWSTEQRCYLEDLFVAPGARCGGVGAALIHAVYAAADARGSDQVYWLTEEDNHTAQALYDRLARRTPFVKYQR